MGGYPRLAQLLLQAASHRPIGDVLSYVEAMQRPNGHIDVSPEPEPEPAAERETETIPEITAPPGTLWDDVLEQLADTGVTRLNVERVRTGIRCLGWAGDELVLAISDPETRYMRPVLERAILQVLGVRPQIRYAEQFGASDAEEPSRAPPVGV